MLLQHGERLRNLEEQPALVVIADETLDPEYNAKTCAPGDRRNVVNACR